MLQDQQIGIYIGDNAAKYTCVFKGFLGSSSTITALPTTYEMGWMYIVDNSGKLKTYAGQLVDVGDCIMAMVDRNGVDNQDDDWLVLPINWQPSSKECAALIINEKISALDHQAEINRNERKKNV